MIAHGVECMLALRQALGPDAMLMVDCHWRFDETRALQALQALAPAALHWFECPIAETHAHWPAMRRLRAATREQGVLLAAANRVFRSTDRGDSWTAISPDLTKNEKRDDIVTMGLKGSDIAISRNDGISQWPTIVALSESPKQKGVFYHEKLHKPEEAEAAKKKADSSEENN